MNYPKAAIIESRIKSIISTEFKPVDMDKIIGMTALTCSHMAKMPKSTRALLNNRSNNPLYAYYLLSSLSSRTGASIFMIVRSFSANIPQTAAFKEDDSGYFDTIKSIVNSIKIEDFLRCCLVLNYLPEYPEDNESSYLAIDRIIAFKRSLSDYVDHLRISPPLTNNMIFMAYDVERPVMSLVLTANHYVLSNRVSREFREKAMRGVLKENANNPSYWWTDRARLVEPKSLGEVLKEKMGAIGAADQK